MARTIPALFENHDEASRAVQDLVSHGFARNDISVMARNGTRPNGHSGLARGAGLGAAAGGISGLVIGASALLAVPAIGLAISVPALISTLLGAGVGAATGGLLGALTKLGIPKEQAHYYSEGIRRGGVLVAVETPENRTEEARTILSRHNPIELSTRAEELHQSGWTRFEPYTEPSHMPEAARAAGAASAVGTSQASPVTATAVAQRDKAERQATIPVVEEVVPVGNRATEAKNGVETIHDTAHHMEVDVERAKAPQESDIRGFDAYDADFRRHFSTTFAQQPGATYDIYMPAYRYGYTLATDERYNNCAWFMLEAEARRGWEREHPGTWERFKPAIQHGWEEVREHRENKVL